ncbi:MAG: glycosyltransferase [Myxococcota bacterium]
MIRLTELTPNFGTGGIEVRVARVLSGLSRDEFELRWACLGAEPYDTLQTISGPGIAMERFRKRASPLHVDLQLIWELAAYFRRTRPDIVRIHNYATSIYGILGARLAGVPHVIYESAGREHPEGPSVRQVALLRALGAQVDCVLTVCQVLATEARASMGLSAADVRVMPTGIDLARFRPEDRGSVRQRFGIPEGAFVMGTVGIFRPVKRVEDILSAGLEVLRHRAEAHLLIVGAEMSGVVPDSYYQRAKEYGVADRCHFPGRILGAEHSVAAFDVFLNASTFEGASNAIVEAMAAGAAIIATAAGGNVDVVEAEETGLLVPTGDVEGMVRAALRLHDDPQLLRGMRLKARQVAERRHGLPLMVDTYARLFREIAARPARSSSREAWATLRGLVRGVSVLARGATG